MEKYLEINENSGKLVPRLSQQRIVYRLGRQRSKYSIKSKTQSPLLLTRARRIGSKYILISLIKIFWQFKKIGRID